MSILPGIAAAGAGLIGNLATNYTGRKLAKYQYSQDLAQWNRENAYNHPSAQMARLKQAGLNPNLVYGTGSVGNTTTQGPKQSTPDISYDGAQLSELATGVLNAYAQIKNTNAQTENTRANTAVQNEEAALKKLQQEIAAGTAKKIGIDVEVGQQTKLSQIDAAKENVNKLKEEIKLISQNTQKSKVETEYKGKQIEIAEQERIFKKFEAQLAEKGIYRHDSIYLRVLSRTLSEANVSLESAWDAIEEYIKNIPANAGKIWDNIMN